jgi:hypothetical protein
MSLTTKNINILRNIDMVFTFLAYFPKGGLCDLHAVCVSVNPPY